jgi:hypothetical protein
MKTKNLGQYHVNNESIIQYILITDVPDKKTINKEIKNFNFQKEGDNIFGDYFSRCNCSHDCCGHWIGTYIDLLSYNDIYTVAIASIHYNMNV